MSFATGGGSLVTFYSWKGGVGRTLALANTAVQLARRGRRVLMVDWDLEAPGLHHYFLTPGTLERKFLQVTAPSQAGGLWSLLSAASKRGDGKAERKDWEQAIARIVVPPLEASHTRSFVPTPYPIDLLPAGHVSADYGPQLSAFSWELFFRDSNGGKWLESIREQWAMSYDFVLIDSRTGVTDSGGVCTIQLPDSLVLVFSANDQSFDGGLKVVAAAQQARGNYGYDRGQLTVVPLLSRWAGDQETDIAEEWMQRFERELPSVMASWLPSSFSPPAILGARSRSTRGPVHLWRTAAGSHA